MDTSNTLITGIAPEHLPALLAGLCLPVAAWVALRFLRALAADGSAWAASFADRYDAASLASRLTAALLLTTAAIHLALPLGHGGPLTLLFLASGAACTRLALTFFTDRPWRGRAALVLIANIVAYLVFAGSGWQEEPDQVGIATKLVELAALGLVMIPALRPAHAIRSRMKRPAATAAFVSITLTTGLVLWLGAFVAHQQADAVAQHDHEPGTAPHEHSAGHAHAFMARAQAGTVVRPGSSGPPTPAQVEVAAQFAEATKAGITRYQDPQAAIADGYTPDGPMLGMERHYKNKAYEKDGKVLDPERPELLVYASNGGRQILLGAAYVMPKASTPGPQIGGSLTRWHAHNICVTLLPPAFGLVSPFGTCPTGSVAITLPEMIHVWSVDYPGGPYADHLDEKFVKGLLQEETQD
jgi:hypothetical protein